MLRDWTEQIFDHVSPLEVETAAVGNAGEPFHTLGVRVPALIVSPLVHAGGVYKGVLDHTSILTGETECVVGGQIRSADPRSAPLAALDGGRRGQ